MAEKIMIDAGHGGYDKGATYNGRNEKDDNLRLALAVGEILKQEGFDVEFTRTTDVYDSPLRKAQIANESGADFFVSIHRNSAATPNLYSGVQTLVYDDSGIKAAMARNINEEVAKLGFRNINVEERPDLTVLRRTEMPAVLVEAGFINSDTDNALFDEKFDELAHAIARGITDTIAPREREFYVQLGLFRVYANAQYLLDRVLTQGYDAEIVKKGEFYAVQAGPYDTLNEAQQAEAALRKKGFDTLIVTV